MRNYLRRTPKTFVYDASSIEDFVSSIVDDKKTYLDVTIIEHPQFYKKSHKQFKYEGTNPLTLYEAYLPDNKKSLFIKEHHNKSELEIIANTGYKVTDVIKKKFPNIPVKIYNESGMDITGVYDILVNLANKAIPKE